MSYFSTSGTIPTNGGTGVVLQPNGIVQSIFSEIMSVATGSSATILSYTVPSGQDNYLLGVEVSGTNVATYDILIDGTAFARTRTYFSGPFMGQIHVGSSLIDAYKLVTGQVITILVTNFRPDPGDFEARLSYIEV